MAKIIDRVKTEEPKSVVDLMKEMRDDLLEEGDNLGEAYMQEKQEKDRLLAENALLRQQLDGRGEQPGGEPPIGRWPDVLILKPHIVFLLLALAISVNWCADGFARPPDPAESLLVADFARSCEVVLLILWFMGARRLHGLKHIRICLGIWLATWLVVSLILFNRYQGGSDAADALARMLLPINWWNGTSFNYAEKDAYLAMGAMAALGNLYHYFLVGKLPAQALLDFIVMKVRR